MRKSLKIISGIFAPCAFALFSACGGGNLIARDSFAYFGAQMRWAYVSQGEEKDFAVWREILARAEEIENSVSVDGDGPVARFNRAEAGATVELDATSYALLTTAGEVYRKTEGAYNPATGSLVDLWGFSPRFSEGDGAPVQPYDRERYWEELPEKRYIEAFLQLCDYSQIKLFEDGGRYFAQKPACSVTVDGVVYTMRLDLGGIGKGMCTDEARDIILRAGYRYGYYNLGGSSMFALQNPSQREENGVRAWEIGVADPRGSGDYMSVKEADCRLCTSGDYVNFYTVDGVRYCHTIDPLTGYPVNASPDGDGGGIVSASVFGLSAAEGDATSTALMVMGKERALDYTREYLSDCRVSLVWCDGAGNYTVYTNIAAQNYTFQKSGWRLETI